MAEQQHQIENNIQLLTAKEAAQMCRLSKRSWFRLSSSQGTPPSIKISGSLRWRKDFVEFWIEMSCPDRKTFEAQMEERMAKHRQGGQV